MATESNTIFFETILTKALKMSIKVWAINIVGGGCINRAFQVKTATNTFFIKVNKADKLDMFRTERSGLSMLKENSDFSIPHTYYHGIYNDMSYIIMDYVVPGLKSLSFWQRLGTGLSNLHRHSSSFFGLDHNNYIGSLPQTNTLNEDWIDFFIKNRLLSQLNLACEKALIVPEMVHKFNVLFKKLPDLLPTEPASLLHGDLWSGNIMASTDGKPVLIDPAIYYGHREAEIAFTRLFGGFDNLFYDSYQECYPLQAGFEQRTDIYNLYPLLVHLNLFGSGYLNDIVHIIHTYTR